MKFLSPGMLFSKLTYALVVTALFFFASCKTYKQIPYFQDISDTIPKSIVEGTNYRSPLIQVDDNLNITILTIDPTATMPINQANVATPTSPTLNGGGGAASASAAGGLAAAITQAPTSSQAYLVDVKGEVDIPFLGKVKLAGLTTAEARDTIEKMARNYFLSPTVSVRFTNFTISVLGEVIHPAAYTMPFEKVTVLDAISYAGDLTIYGRRDNVLVIRADSTGKNQFVRMDLTSSKMFQSPYFYLKQNDVVYVTPNKSKQLNSDGIVARQIAIGGAVLSVLLIALLNVKKF